MAWVNTPTEMSDKLIVEAELAAANELMLFPPVAPSENLAAAKVDALMVRADRSNDLLTLTVGPPVGLACAGQPEPAQIRGAGYVRATA